MITIFKRCNRLLKGISMTAASLLFLLDPISEIQAQTIYPPSMTTPVLLTSSLSDPHINCDMFRTANGYTLSAIVYDNMAGGNVVLHTLDNVGNTSVLSIPNAMYPDVVIANADVGSGISVNRYIVAVIYRSTVDSKVYLNTYFATNMGFSSFYITPYQPAQLISNYPGTYLPHIDMFADPIPASPPNWNNNLPVMHEFVMSWDENTPGANRIFTNHGSIYPTISLSTPAAIGPYAQFSDVAASYDVATGQRNAYILIGEAGVVVEYNCTTNSVTANIPIGGTSQDLPRIEAMGLYVNSGSNSAWSVVADDGGSIWLYSQMNPGGINCTSPFFIQDHRTPAIAAGVGDPFTTDYCNENYVFGWLDNNQGLYLTQTLDYPSNILPTPVDYFQVNGVPSAPFGGKEPFAISSSSNLGRDLLTVWFQNGDIYYKYTNNNLSYRPTGLSEIGSEGSYTLSPNPAKSRLLITSKDTHTINHVEMYDVRGVRVYSSDVKGGTLNIDVAAFSRGLYNVVITDDKNNFLKKTVVLN